jgi:hypothetical protein
MSITDVNMAPHVPPHVLPDPPKYVIPFLQYRFHSIGFNCQNQALRIGGSCDGCGSFTSSSLDFFLVAESSFFAICTAHSPRVQRFNFPWPRRRNLKNRDWDAGWRRILTTFLALPADAAQNFMYFTHSKHTSLARSAAGLFVWREEKRSRFPLDEFVKSQVSKVGPASHFEPRPPGISSLRNPSGSQRISAFLEEGRGKQQPQQRQHNRSSLAADIYVCPTSLVLRKQAEEAGPGCRDTVRPLFFCELPALQAALGWRGF